MESGVQVPLESTVWIPESKTVLDYMGRVGGDGRGNGDEGGGNNDDGDGGADEEVIMVRIMRMVWQWLVMKMVALTRKNTIVM